MTRPETQSEHKRITISVAVYEHKDPALYAFLTETGRFPRYGERSEWVREAIQAQIEKEARQ